MVRTFIPLTGNGESMTSSLLAALGARILAGLNTVYMASIGRVCAEQQWKNDFP